MPTTSTGIVTWADTAGPYVNQATQQMGASLDPLVVGSFAGRGQRDAAYAAMIGSGMTGMTCYVAGYGLCFYDGNSRVGSLGWTWNSTNINIWDQNGMGQQSASDGTSRSMVATGPITLPSPRRVNIHVQYNPQADNPNTQVISWVTAVSGMTMPTLQFATEVITVGGPGRQTVSMNYTGRATSPLEIHWDLKPSVGGVGYAFNGYFQITDLGPTD